MEAEEEDEEAVAAVAAVAGTNCAVSCVAFKFAFVDCRLATEGGGCHLVINRGDK